MRLAVIALAATVALACHAQAAAPDMKEGLWELTAKSEIQGMPGGMPPTTMQRCVTKKDLEDPSKTAPGLQGDKRCKMTDYRLQGNTATWKLACEGENAMTGSGTVTYAGTSYTGTQTMSMSVEGKALNMTLNFSGRHLGECTK
ncbi:MAG TPA: DUF3617 family protein [Burkholderiales bacterium]|nr:DUF3617 family protein [Burkholderiales bacterium]